MKNNCRIKLLILKNIKIISFLRSQLPIKTLDFKKLNTLIMTILNEII